MTTRPRDSDREGDRGAAPTAPKPSVDVRRGPNAPDSDELAFVRALDQIWDVAIGQTPMAVTFDADRRA